MQEKNPVTEQNELSHDRTPSVSTAPTQLPCIGKLRDELTCSICLDICIRPCTTPCGHNFCRRCLRGALQYNLRCPKCREKLPAGTGKHVNTVLWNTIQLLFPHTETVPASPVLPHSCAGFSPRDSESSRVQHVRGDETLADLVHTVRIPDTSGTHPTQGLPEFLSRLDLSDQYDLWQMVSSPSDSGEPSGLGLEERLFHQDSLGSESVVPEQEPHRRILSETISPGMEAMQLLRNAVSQFESSFPRHLASQNPSRNSSEENMMSRGQVHSIPVQRFVGEWQTVPVDNSEMALAMQSSPSSSSMSGELPGRMLHFHNLVLSEGEEYAEDVVHVSENSRLSAIASLPEGTSDVPLRSQETSPQDTSQRAHQTHEQEHIPETSQLQRIAIAEARLVEHFVEGTNITEQTRSHSSGPEDSDDDYAFGLGDPATQIYPYHDHLGSALLLSSAQSTDVNRGSPNSVGVESEEWLDSGNADCVEYLHSTGALGTSQECPVSSSIARTSYSINDTIQSIDADQTRPGISQHTRTGLSWQLPGPNFGLARLSPESQVHPDSVLGDGSRGVPIGPAPVERNQSEVTTDLYTQEESTEPDEGPASEAYDIVSTSSSGEGSYSGPQLRTYEEFLQHDYVQEHRVLRRRPTSTPPSASYYDVHDTNAADLIDVGWQEYFSDSEDIEPGFYVGFAGSHASILYSSGDAASISNTNETSSVDRDALYLRDDQSPQGHGVNACGMPSHSADPRRRSLQRISVTIPRGVAHAVEPRQVPRVIGGDSGELSPTTQVADVSTGFDTAMEDNGRMTPRAQSARSRFREAGEPMGVWHYFSSQSSAALLDRHNSFAAAISDEEGRQNLGQMDDRQRRMVPGPGHAHHRVDMGRQGDEDWGVSRSGEYSASAGYVFAQDSASDLGRHQPGEHREREWYIDSQQLEYACQEASGEMLQCTDEHERGRASVPWSLAPGEAAAGGQTRRGFENRHCTLNRHLEAVNHIEIPNERNAYSPCIRPIWSEWRLCGGGMLDRSGTRADPAVLYSDDELDPPTTSGWRSPVGSEGSRATRVPNRINQIVSRLRRYRPMCKRTIREM